QAGFLRMKLHAKDVVALHSCGKSPAVLAGRHRLVNHWSAIRVGVIEEFRIGNAPQQARAAAKVDPVPAHVRRRYRRREAGAWAGKQSSSGCIRSLCAAIEQPLHAYTDSKKRLATCDGFQHGLAQTRIKRLAAGEMSYAWNKDLFGDSDHGWIGGYLGAGA